MSDNLNKLQEYILYQEQWNRTTLSNFSLNSFTEIEALIRNLNNQERTEIAEICATQVQKNKNNVYAIYIAGIIAMDENSLHDEYLIMLLDFFAEHHKYNIIEYVAKKILKYRNNLQALRRLAEVCEANNRHEELVQLWEQISRLDYEESDMVMKLAEHYLKHDEVNSAIHEYKKAMERYLHQKNYSAIKNIWNILVDKNPNDIDYFFRFINKMEKILNTIRSEELLQALFLKHENTQNYDTIIIILKYLLRLDPENEQYRNDLAKYYREKYQENPKLEDFIRLSNLTQSWRNVHEAISDFEKHIAFFPGSFVFHNKWGIGRIKDTTHQHLVIDFSRKRDHKMEISMAVGSLEALPKDHFWVLKSIVPKEKLKQQILSKPKWGLKKIIVSLGGADMKTIKKELHPALLTANEWTQWNVKAKKILQTDEYFGIVPEKNDFYLYSNTPINPVEKFNAAFRMEDTFLNKVKLMRKALQDNVFENNSDIDIFLSKIDYFNAFITMEDEAETSPYNEYFVHSLFLCEEIAQRFPKTTYHIHLALKDVVSRMTPEDTEEIIQLMRINDYKDMFYEYVKKYRTDWREVYLLMIPHYHNTSFITSLEQSDELALLQKMATHLQNNATHFKGAFVWFATHLYGKKWYQDVTSEFKIYTDLIRVATLVYKDIQNKYQVPKGRRLFNNIEKFLFTPTEEHGHSRLVQFIESHEEKQVVYLYSLIKPISDGIPSRILDIRDTILQHHPEFDFNDQFNFEQTGSTGFLTLINSYEERKKMLQHIHEVEVPQNSKEIEKARSFGDLKENAEYKAALEHQDKLNNRVAQLKREIEQARIFDIKNISMHNVGFGTRISLLNLKDNTKNNYILLGPWESDPEKGIISYLSPLGKQLYNRKLHEKIEFTLDNTLQSVRIEKIEQAIE